MQLDDYLAASKVYRQWLTDPAIREASKKDRRGVWRSTKTKQDFYEWLETQTNKEIAKINKEAEEKTA